MHPQTYQVPEKTHVVNTDDVDEAKSYMYSNDVALRRIMWLPYNEAIRRPRGSCGLENPEFEQWFLKERKEQGRARHTSGVSPQ